MIHWIIFIYLIAGVSIVLLTPARQVIRESLSDEALGQDAERWMILLLYAICYSSAVVLWPFF